MRSEFIRLEWWIVSVVCCAEFACSPVPCPAGTVATDVSCTTVSAIEGGIAVDDIDGSVADGSVEAGEPPSAGRDAIGGAGRGFVAWMATSGASGAPAARNAGASGGGTLPVAGEGAAPAAGAGGLQVAADGGMNALPLAADGGATPPLRSPQAGAGAPPPMLPTCMSSPELCDAQDNDCDGKTDEGLIMACDETSAVGVCRAGRTTCSGGVWSACMGAVRPSDEKCDVARLDENCDGTPNEGCECAGDQSRACGKDQGICSPGTQRCMNGRWGVCTGAVDPHQKEVCDRPKLDEDCDGVANPNCACFDGDSEACSGNAAGECDPGRRTCLGGSWSGCTGAIGVSDELCNGKDDDCDGATDDSPKDCVSPSVCSGGRCMAPPPPPAAPPPTCGNGKLDSDEQCDPMIAGSSELCDSGCKRTVYQTCSSVGAACANDQFCTPFTLDQQAGTRTTPVCSRACLSGADCPLAQGGSAHAIPACNLGFCVLLCDDTSSCPTGLSCQALTFFDSRDAPGRGLKGCLSP